MKELRESHATLTSKARRLASKLAVLFVISPDAFQKSRKIADQAGASYTP